MYHVRGTMLGPGEAVVNNRGKVMFSGSSYFCGQGSQRTVQQIISCGEGSAGKGAGRDGMNRGATTLVEWLGRVSQRRF